MKVFALVFLICNVIPVSNAFAWGPDGHKIVCFIAFELLDEEDQEELRRLVREFEFENTAYRYYSSSCNFADLARARVRNYRDAVRDDHTYDVEVLEPWERYAAFDRQHFVNLERSDSVVDLDDCSEENGCAFTAINFHRDQLANPDDFERAEAAILLGHWIGDIHQPLHVSFADDLGGNNINNVDGLYGNNQRLHGVWDSGIIKITLRSRNVGWLSYARTISAEISDQEITQWSNGDAVDWAQESFDIAIARTTKYCRQTSTECKWRGRSRNLGRDYQEVNAPIIEQQLKKAGVRLSFLLAEGLSSQ